jgi:hypothetical protein
MFATALGRSPVFAQPPFGLYRVCALCLVNSTLGLRLSVVFPSAISAAGEIPGRVLGLCHGIAIGYGGFLVGAPLINALADVMGQVK